MRGYSNPCVVCGARPMRPCRTMTTGRTTDTHMRRVNGEWPATVEDVRTALRGPK